jgi:pyruvate dehydrogenase E1 component beta subunit
VIEMRIFDFTLCAVDELANQIAKIRYMTGGQARPALVVRMPHGMWRSSAAQHSQALEAWFAHLPGVVAAAPATPADAAGLLVAAIRSDDPVLVFEPKDLWQSVGPVPDTVEPLPFGVARRVREGGDLTLVSWSALVPAAERAAAALAERGIGVDLLDLRSLWPWDEAAVCASVSRTGRLLVAQEAVTAAGFGAEVAARVVERLGPARVRAVRRLGFPRVPVPFAPPLEAALRVTPERIVDAGEAMARA